MLFKDFRLDSDLKLRDFGLAEKELQTQLDLTAYKLNIGLRLHKAETRLGLGLAAQRLRNESSPNPETSGPDQPPVPRSSPEWLHPEPNRVHDLRHVQE
ncbi:hypothetical protein QTP86_008492 [Hemibagrus guttatus]|nr:hypothetical protein QTP86_008492 [Hemibagrus guttatus]